MKKFFKRISLVLLMGTLGMSVTSCDSDVVTLISQLIGGIFNQGETYTYQGISKATAMIYVGDQEKQNSTKETDFTNQTVQIVARQGQNGNVADLTLPDFTWEQIQVSGLKLYNLDLTTANNISTLAINTENASIDGTFTYGGKTYTACYAEIAKVQVTQTAIYIEMKAQFADENNNYMQIEFKFQGSANTQNKQ